MIHVQDPFWPPKAVGVVEELATCGNGLAISSFSLSTRLQEEYEIDVARALQTIGRMLERALCATGCASQSKSAVRKIELGSLDAYRIGRVCSAIAETRTAEELSLSVFRFHMTPAMQRRVWGSLAYALFSKRARARSSISSVHLKNIFMSEADTEAVAAVLAAHDPAKHVLGRNVHRGPSTSVPDRHHPDDAVVQEGTLATMQRMDPQELLRPQSVWWELETDVSGVQVLEDRAAFPDDDVVRVLIPGYGVCEVARDEIVPVNDEAAPQEATKGVSSLKMTFCDDAGATAGVPRFIQLIGASPTWLHLDISTDETLLLGDMLSSCPNVTSLTIEIGTTVSSETFLQGYRASNMRIAALDCFFDDLPAVVRDIADKSSQLSRTLKRLMLYAVALRQVMSAERMAQIAAELVAISNMLKVNRTLNYVELTASRELMEPSRAIADRFHKEALPDVTAEFPLKCRLAFLSVFSSCRDDQEHDAKRAKHDPGLESTSCAPPLSSSRAPSSLDQHALSIIFGFAAECACRRMYVNHF